MKNKLIKIIKLILLIIFNNIISMILGFLWYKLGFAQTKISDLSGVDTLHIVFAKFKYIYYFILFIIELGGIIHFKQLFNNKQTCIIYYILTFIFSMILSLVSNLGFNTGWNFLNYGEAIKGHYIFIACVGLRYTTWILSLNIPTLLGLISISSKNISYKNKL